MLAERKKILLRADGNSESGLGHMYRILALAEAFSDEHECVILTRIGSSDGIIGNRYSVCVIPELNNNDEVLWLAGHYPPSQWILVADGYHFTTDYQKAAKDSGYYFIYIDDLVKGHYFADVVVNHSPCVRFRDYVSEPYTRFAFGTEYALLRKRFLMGRLVKERANSRSVAFVCFGGADPFNLGVKAASALADFREITAVHVVVGAAFSKESLSAIKNLSDKINVYVNMRDTEISGLMESCDFAISSASTILYELCALQVPTLAGYYVENQQGLYNGFVNAGAIAGAGDISKYGPEQFGAAIHAFLSQTSWKSYATAQKKLFDGKSHKRLSQLLNAITYRKATEKDLMLVFEWSNDNVTRGNSYSSQPIDFNSHKDWFRNKIRNDRSVMLICECNGTPAGLIRFDMNEGHAVTGVLVDARFRGMGLAILFLRDATRIFIREHKIPVYAYIKVTNLPSVKAFEKAGYKLSEEKVVQGAPSYIYKITENDV